MFKPRTLLATLRHGSILDAVNAALALRQAGGLDRHVVEALGSEIERGDGTARLLALHSLAQQRDEMTQLRFLNALMGDDRGVREHAAWILGDRPPDARALPSLIEVLDDGGFGGMLAQLTLERWGLQEAGLVAEALDAALGRAVESDHAARYVETLGLLPHLAGPVPASIGRNMRPAARTGLRLAQVMLQGRLDSGLTGAGAGDGGGLATLLVSLTRALDAHPSVAEVITFTRGFADPTMPELYSPRRDRVGLHSSIERLRFGSDSYLATSEQWPFRVQIEQELTRALRSTQGFDAAHLRFADIGTFAAARVFRRLGVPIVFTLAPDPHAVLRDAEASGELSRETFAAADLEHHYVFRARLVDWMLRHADALATLPRPNGDDDFRALLGAPFDAVPRRRLRRIPEGITIDAHRRNRRPLASPASATQPRDVSGALSHAIQELPSARRGLPLILTVSRLHRVKGIPLLVDAWSGDPELFADFNLVVVGGGLERPTAEEQLVLDEIAAICRRRESARDGLVLFGHWPNDDVSRLLGIAAEGIPHEVAPGAVYACASRKEEFGLALLEALAAGLSAVGPNAGGPPTYIDDDRTGFLTDTTSIAGLRDGLHRAAAARLDEARAARARRLVSERFTVTAMADKLVSLYEDVRGASEMEAA
jgi:glycosyltransferase involved in cell wall biosynthesis